MNKYEIFMFYYLQTGGLCRLTNEKGEEMICNVEYNQLEDVIKNTIDPRGDFADNEGYSP